MSTIILLFLIIDPLGNLPVFMSILKHIDSKRRRIIIFREMLIALLLMLIFLFAGQNILSLLNLQTETVSISGGILLFIIAIKMISPPQEERNLSFSANDEPFLVPLATPLVAGPSILATLMLLSHQHPYQINYLVLALFIAWSISVCILMMSNIFLRLLGSKGMNVLERLMGLLLVMVSTQMFMNGLQVYLHR